MAYDGHNRDERRLQDTFEKAAEQGRELGRCSQDGALASIRPEYDDHIGRQQWEIGYKRIKKVG